MTESEDHLPSLSSLGQTPIDQLPGLFSKITTSKKSFGPFGSKKEFLCSLAIVLVIMGVYQFGGIGGKIMALGGMIIFVKWTVLEDRRKGPVLEDRRKGPVLEGPPKRTGPPASEKMKVVSIIPSFSNDLQRNHSWI